MKENDNDNNNDFIIYNMNTNNDLFNDDKINNIEQKGEFKKRKTPTKKGKKRKINEIENNIEVIPVTTENLEVKEDLGIKIDNLAEKNIDIRNIIDKTLFSQLSDIKVFLLDFENDVSKKLYKVNKKILPKIEYFELNLLNQGVNISEFKKYGFGLYIFFLYLISLLVTFGLLVIFAFHYIYCIFYKYYQDLKVECSPFFECNILSLASGVQIIKFRRYIIEKFGKKAFLDNYKDFDVIYKEYIYSGVIVFVVVFLINFSYILYSRKVYKEYKKENPEINNYTLILSGKNLPYIDNEQNGKSKKIDIESKKEVIKNKIKKELKVDDVDVSFTLQLSEYYEAMNDFMEKRKEITKLQCKITENCCLFWCCEKSKLNEEMEELKRKINNLKEQEEKYNPLYLLTFQNKEDYDNIYSRYPHSYLQESIKNICKKERRNIYINKASSPEDIAWENLEFDNEYKYFINKFKNLGIGSLYISVSFGCQLLLDYIGDLGDSTVLHFFVNIITSILQEKGDKLFSGKIEEKLSGNLSNWSYSDINFYCILYNSIFNFLNTGICPLFTYLILDRIRGKDNDFSSLVQKMFVVLEMKGFGYPMIDLFYYIIYKKARKMFKAQKEMMGKENIDKSIEEQVNNTKGISRLELEKTFKKPKMKLDEKYSEILSLYWITMLYLSLYPIGIIQTFLNLLFIFIIEKNLLINIYQRPDYISPHFGFLCFNCFNFGFFLFLLGDLIFFRNEDNKDSFGVGYIIVMILFLILPFFLLAKLIIYCYYKNEKTENLEKVKQKMISDYRIFNPCYQKKEIMRLFSEFRDKNLLMQSQYEEIEKKLNKLNDLDLYKLQQNLKIPKKFSFQIKKIDSTSLKGIYYNKSYEQVDQEKSKLFNLLMRLDLLSYLEEGNFIRPNKKKFEFIDDLDDSSLSLQNLSVQENLSNSDSSHFTTFYEKRENEDDKLIMAYVDNGKTVKLFNVFDREALGEVKERPTMKIVCIDSFKVKKENGIKIYIVTLSLDNKMIITDFSSKKLIKIIDNIGDTFKANKNKKKAMQIFSLSSAENQGNIWIITSYYYDQAFKIYDDSGKHIKTILNQNEYIISLEASELTEENTYICVRSTSDGDNQRIHLFINEFYIKKLYDVNDSYINFKIVKYYKYKYIFVSKIKKDLSKYYIDLIDIFPIFPLYIPVFHILISYANRDVMGLLKKFENQQYGKMMKLTYL